MTAMVVPLALIVLKFLLCTSPAAGIETNISILHTYCVACNSQPESSVSAVTQLVHQINKNPAYLPGFQLQVETISETQVYTLVITMNQHALFTSLMKW